MTTTITTPAIAAGTYTIDPARSRVAFAIKEMYGLLTVRGTIALRDGTIVVADQPAGASVRVRLDPGSIATGNKRRDRDVTGKNFVDAATYPDMAFAGTGVVRDADGWTLTGDLTVHGTTAPVTLRLHDGRPSQGGYAFTATAVVDRTEFGVSRAVGFIGRTLDVTIEVVATSGVEGLVPLA